MSYHKLSIHKHKYGSPYKIYEEFLEYVDALSNDNKIMALVELSDLFGVIENEAEKLGVEIKDLKIMSDTTKKVFISGSRENFNLVSYLKENYDSIKSFGLGFIQVKCGDINYNFYHKDLEKFADHESPHNHQRDFISEVISGIIEESVYKLVLGDKKGYCGCGNGEILEGLDYQLIDKVVHKEGDLYMRLKGEYHSVSAKHGTITKFTKYGDNDDAYVITERPLEHKKCELSNQEMWEKVEEVFGVNK